MTAARSIDGEAPDRSIVVQLECGVSRTPGPDGWTHAEDNGMRRLTVTGPAEALAELISSACLLEFRR